MEKVQVGPSGSNGIDRVSRDHIRYVPRLAATSESRSMSVRSYIVDDRETKTFLLDREVLVSEEILRREMAQIFGRCWIYVGHSSELKDRKSTRLNSSHMSI